ncbi:MAG TPA: hybrid sensor histidine kinase/response regulator [Labilithrix sp.]|nr:hybrid sensor histidine kinase/response regulator [Labilithrix sp.]
MSPNRAAAGATILVIDDDEGNLEMTREALAIEGYRVVLAQGGEEGILAFARAPADCVLLDVRMPGIDGFTTCERIRTLPGGADVPVLFLTAQRDIDTFDRALRSGGNDFLTKPTRSTELVVRTQSALKLRRMSVELRGHYDLLKRQRDDLLRLQLHKERLTAFVVHDLENPVDAMDVHAQVLLDSEGLGASARDSALQIRAAAAQLRRMILDLLDVSLADEGKLAPRRSAIDLCRLVDEVRAELGATAQAHAVTLDGAIEALVVHADEALFRRTLANLIDNAIRYAPTGTAVTVSARSLDGATELRVADVGRGIPAAMRERVFGAFVQVEEGERVVAHGSRGLGLTFCKLAVEAHGGRIWIEDGAPGAVFCVSLPDAP